MKLFASSSYAAGILDVSTGAVEPILDYPRMFSALHLSPDGSLLAFADAYHRTVHMRRRISTQYDCTFTLPSWTNTSLPIAFSRDGKNIVSITGLELHRCHCILPSRMERSKGRISSKGKRHGV